MEIYLANLHAFQRTQLKFGVKRTAFFANSVIVSSGILLRGISGAVKDPLRMNLPGFFFFPGREGVL